MNETEVANKKPRKGIETPSSYNLLLLPEAVGCKQKAP